MKTNNAKRQGVVTPVVDRARNIVVMPIVYQGKTSKCHSGKWRSPLKSCCAMSTPEPKKTKEDMNLPKQYPLLIMMDSCGPHVVKTEEIVGERYP